MTIKIKYISLILLALTLATSYARASSEIDYSQLTPRKARPLAVNGDSKAQLWMGNYKSNFERKNNQREAVDWFEKAALNPKNSQKEAVEKIYTIINQKTRENQYDFEETANSINNNKLNEKLLDLANKGNAKAQYELGCKYFDSKERIEQIALKAGVLFDPEGVELIYKSALQFHNPAIVKLASIAKTILK
ncbi:hypothetical protein IM40_11415 (plasmid) [Candidatus Paracaedimonas acanthamoebae]|nr:hypothetical protein IM40_11415 [Candidatus Paracaedimonas acanthamoebae]